jgi:hypothetical protein
MKKEDEVKIHFIFLDVYVSETVAGLPGEAGRKINTPV